MKKYEVLLSETAIRQLKDLPVDLQERIKSALAMLSDEPYRPRPKVDIKKLKGPERNYYRLRVGDYRAIYVIEEDKIMVAKILLRSKAYNWLE